MYQIDNATAATSQPASTPAGSPGFFTDGNPATNVPATIVPAEWLNAVMMEMVNVVIASGLALNKGSFNQVLTALNTMHSPIVGATRNARMSVTAASATATFTADEVIVATGLNGQTYRIANFNEPINLATTGAGGMDTGAAPASGYVALYAIYNPTTGASALIGKNATAAVQPSVYGGANMPAGYTASALVGVWPTNGSGQFKPGCQRDRRLSFPLTSIINSSSTSASFNPISISGVVPPNAISVNVTLSALSTAVGTVQTLVIAGDVIGSGSQVLSGMVSVAGNANANNGQVPLITPQTLYWNSSNSGGTPTFSSNVTSYDI